MISSKKRFVISWIIVIIAVVAIGVGIYFSQQKAISTTVTPHDPNSNIYSNNQYSFQFQYPKDFSTQEHSNPFYVELKDPDDFYPVQVYAGDNNDPTIVGLINPTIDAADVESEQGTVTVGGTLWNKFEYDGIPQEGLGTASSELTYYTKKDNTTYVLQCLDCSTDTFGDLAEPGLSAFNQVVSTFTFSK